MNQSWPCAIYKPDGFWKKNVRPIWWLIIHHFRHEQMPYIGDTSDKPVWIQPQPLGIWAVIWGVPRIFDVFGSVGKGILAWSFFEHVWCLAYSIYMCFMIIWWLYGDCLSGMVIHGMVIHGLSAYQSYVSFLNRQRICPFGSPAHGGL